MPVPPPPYSAQWTATGGAWENASNWLETDLSNNQPVHYVPSADNAVQISDNGSPGYTVSYNSDDTIWSIGTGSNVTLDLQSGALAISHGGSVSGALKQEAGASLSIGAGYALVVNSGSYAGTLTGAGRLVFVGGAEALNTTDITVATLEFGVNGDGFGSTTSLGLDVSYAGQLLLDDYTGNNATLNLNGHTFTATGDATLDGTITGAGTFNVTHTATLQNDFNVNGGASFVAVAGSTVTQTGNVVVGGAGASSGKLSVHKNATYDIVASSFFGDNAGANASINNFGLMDLSNASAVTLNGAFYNVGTLNIGSGSALTLTGASETLTGAITGGGALIVGFGAHTVLAPSQLTVATVRVTGGNAGAFPVLNENLSYGGAFEFESQFGVLNLKTYTLTLTGGANIFSGNLVEGGTLDITGAATTFSGAFGATGHAIVLKDDGAVSQTGAVTINGSLVISAGHSYTFANASSLTSGASAIVNQGTLSANVSGGGQSSINGKFTNAGVLNVAAGNTLIITGTDTLNGSLTGAGTLWLGFGAQVAVNTSNITVADIYINGGNGGGTTSFNASAVYSGIFDFENQFGTLNVAAGKTLYLSGANNTLYGGDIDGGGTLWVSGAARLASNIGNVKATTIQDRGAISQTGNVSLNGSLVIGAGHSYTFTAASSLTGGASTIVNAGTLSANVSGGGQSNLNGAFTNNGTLSVAAGNTLLINGTDTLNGAISGAGTLWLGFGAQAAINTSNITVADIFISGGNGGGTTTFNVNDSYAGVFDFENQFGTLNIATGKTLTLSGMNNTLYGGDIDGGGTVSITGAAKLASAVGNTKATAIVDAGAITQTAT